MSGSGNDFLPIGGDLMYRRQQRSIRHDLLFNLGFLASAAIMVVGVTTAALARIDPGATFPAMIVLWAASTVVFLLFATYLIRRVVSRPLDRLEALAGDPTDDGNEAGDPEFHEFDRVGRRIRALAEQLLEAQGENGGGPPFSRSAATPARSSS